MLKKLSVKNFRSLDNFTLEFNEGLNVIIGENDAGKTSIIDSLKILFSKKKIDINDFRDEEKSVIIKLETEDIIYRFSSKRIEGVLEDTFENKPTEDKCDEILDEICSEEFLELEGAEQRQILRNHCLIFNINVRSNSKPETLVDKISEAIANIDDDTYIETKKLDYPISFLGSKEFDNMNSFFEDTFFKEFKKDVWNHNIGDNTINELLDHEIDLFKDEVLSEDNTGELYSVLADFLPNFKEIELEISQNPHIDLNINVNFLNSDGQEISLEKMGDGTNRRTTMALFRHKQDKDDLCYVFDEPDTHLHIKAQLDIFHLFKDLTLNGKQVIITTHSPFLINEVNPNDIKFMQLNSDNISVNTALTEDIGSNFLKDLGINNIDLFFTNKLLLVEGESEEIFLPIFFEKVYGYPISHKFIKIVKTDGISDVSNFVRVICDTFPNTRIFVLMDNDGSPKEESKLDRIIRACRNISQENVFRLGTNEFEDSFSNEILAKSLQDYIKDDLERDEIIDWNIIEGIRQDCDKFSGELCEFIWDEYAVTISKPKLARYLANNTEKEDIDEKILDLFEMLLE